MTYQPTNNIFLSHQTSQQYFQPWLISQTSQNEQGDYPRLHATLVPWHMHAIIEKQNHFLLPYVSLLSPKMKAKFRHTLMSCLICKPKLNFGQLYRSSYESNMQRKRNKEQRREEEKMKGKTNAMLLCLKDAMPKQILVGVMQTLLDLVESHISYHPSQVNLDGWYSFIFRPQKNISFIFTMQAYNFASTCPNN